MTFFSHHPLLMTLWPFFCHYLLRICTLAPLSSLTELRSSLLHTHRGLLERRSKKLQRWLNGAPVCSLLWPLLMVTFPVPVAHYTAWWQEHTHMNNLPRVVAKVERMEAEQRTSSLQVQCHIFTPLCCRHILISVQMQFVNDTSAHRTYSAIEITDD